MALRKKPGSATVDTPSVEPKRSSTDNPLVFISHDSRDADLAEAFGNLLTDASGGILKSFRSSDKKGTAGIEYGAEWYRAIMQNLDNATDVVALLTARSINRPWILYETGVAKGKLSASDRVFGLALGVKLEEAATGPFAQFQNSPDEEDAITGLVLQLIRRHPQAAPREEAVRRQVKAFRDSVTELLKNRKTDAAPASPKPDDTSVAKFFEEIKVLVRDVPERVAVEVNNGLRDPRSRRRPRFHPGRMEEILYHPALRRSGNPTIPLLIASSMLREDFPWLSELVTHFTRAVEEENSRVMQLTQRSLMQMIELLLSPEGEILGVRDDESMFMVHTLMRMVREIPVIRRVPPATKSAKEKPSPEE